MTLTEFKKTNQKYEDFILYRRKTTGKVNSLLSAVFFDRDGVIIQDCHYIKNPIDVKLCPGVKNLMREFYKKNIFVIVITNQSGISRNLLSWDDYKAVNKKMIQLLGEPNPINAIYANSYTSDKPVSNWRKPNPTMILKATCDLKLNLNKSILIGDRVSDIVTGQRAQVPKIFHVLTGHGKKERGEILKLKKQKNIYNKSKVFCIKDLNQIRNHIIF